MLKQINTHGIILDDKSEYLNVKRKFETVSERKRPGEFSTTYFADGNFSPAGALVCRDGTYTDDR